MENTIESLRPRGQNGVQPLEQDVVARSTVTDSASLEEKLFVAVVLIGCMAQQLLSPDAMALAFLQAKSLCKEHEETLNVVWLAADKMRRSNPASCLF